MRKPKNNAQQLVELARKSGVISARDVRLLGIHNEYIRRMTADGRLVRVGRGLYSLPNANVTENHGLVQASKAVPKGVVCLLSALRFHKIGTQSPFEVWMAIDRRAARPRVSYPKMRFMRSSGKALSAGVAEHRIEGVSVRIYDPAKTVVDCFKYRNKIGLDVALEAMREGLRSRKCSVNDIWRYAKLCRVQEIMRPYMEAMV